MLLWVDIRRCRKGLRMVVLNKCGGAVGNVRVSRGQDSRGEEGYEIKKILVVFQHYFCMFYLYYKFVRCIIFKK